MRCLQEYKGTQLLNRYNNVHHRGEGRGEGEREEAEEAEGAEGGRGGEREENGGSSMLGRRVLGGLT